MEWHWDIFTLVTVISWVGCFVVIAWDSVNRSISPWFWRFAGLFGGPFALVAYIIAREFGKRE